MLARYFSILFLATGLVAGGCFPGGESGSVSVRIPLAQLGVDLDEGDIAGWPNWLAICEQGLDGEPFELGQNGADFYLGIGLEGCAEQEVSLEGVGNVIHLEGDGEQDEALELDLEVSSCTGGVFKVALFWIEEDGLETFTGTSQALDLPPVDQQPIEMDAYLHPVGGLACTYDTDGKQGDLIFSAIDKLENVRLVRARKSATGGPVDFVLGNVPVGRIMSIEVEALESSTVEELAPAAVVTYAGEIVEGACEVP